MILKKITLIIVLAFSLFVYSQKETNIIGEWKVISVDNGEVYINMKTDSVSTTPKFDKTHTNKVSRQNGIAEIRYSSRNEFIFKENGEFLLYMNAKRNSMLLDGTYEYINNSKLDLKVKGRTRREMKKEMEFEFIDDFLLVKFKFLVMRGNKPTEYLLERIK